MSRLNLKQYQRIRQPCDKKEKREREREEKFKASLGSGEQFGLTVFQE